MVYVEDFQVRQWTTISTLACSEKQFKFPYAVAVDNNGKIYVADTYNHRIVVMDDITGKNLKTIGTFGSGE
ncbi:MAG: hypothetical protein F3739_06450, partial [Nitrospinae bacterium]|nr:hypothetical protein [Nitrospinota bacterium]